MGNNISITAFFIAITVNAVLSELCMILIKQYNTVLEFAYHTLVFHKNDNLPTKLSLVLYHFRMKIPFVESVVIYQINSMHRTLSFYSNRRNYDLM